jgi:branched-chain amino acid aminotransferase
MDEAIMLDTFGAVAECASANLFAVLEGTLVTPTTRAALPGITRRTVLELASEAGIPTEVREVWPMELYAAPAVFVTGSGAGVVPVAEIDGHPLASAENRVVRQLIGAYSERTRDPRYIVRVHEQGPAGGAVEATSGARAPKSVEEGGS